VEIAGESRAALALLWLAVGVGGRAEADVMLQKPPGLNSGDPFRFVFVTDGIVRRPPRT